VKRKGEDKTDGRRENRAGVNNDTGGVEVKQINSKKVFS